SSLGARSTISTLAPFSAAACAAQNAALPAPTTTTSYFATRIPPLIRRAAPFHGTTAVVGPFIELRPGAVKPGQRELSRLRLDDLSLDDGQRRGHEASPQQQGKLLG